MDNSNLRRRSSQRRLALDLLPGGTGHRLLPQLLQVGLALVVPHFVDRLLHGTAGRRSPQSVRLRFREVAARARDRSLPLLGLRRDDLPGVRTLPLAKKPIS